jgi:DNA repair protein RecN (Recombination protein N)
MLLDAFAGLSDEAVTLGESYRRWREAERSFKTHKAKVEAAAREADYLRASVEELETLSPQDGEEDDLAERRSRMQKSERIAGDISEASEFLNGNASPVPHIASLMRKLERKSHEAPGLLEETVQLLGSALDTLSSAQMEVEAALRRTEFDPRELERVEERLFALRAAARKYSVAVTGLPALAEKMVVDLADLDAGEERLGQLEAAVTGRITTIWQSCSPPSGIMRPWHSPKLSWRSCRRSSWSGPNLWWKWPATHKPRQPRASIRSNSTCRPIQARDRVRS